MGKHSVACTACTPLAKKWREKHGLLEPEPAGVQTGDGDKTADADENKPSE